MALEQLMDMSEACRSTDDNSMFDLMRQRKDFYSYYLCTRTAVSRHSKLAYNFNAGTYSKPSEITDFRHFKGFLLYFEEKVRGS